MAAQGPNSSTAGAATTPAIPDYLASPNAVFKDQGVQWRYGRAPDYSKTRKVWEEGKRMAHAPGSLEEMVENLVKNWEVEASFKPRLQDWRTIDHEKYSFAMGGGLPMSAEHMIKVGTYNGIIGPNEYYSPENSDFASSHKTFKRMMPTFAWEVLEVYSGPPRVAMRWRHWGYMKNDYVGFNNKGEKVTAKAHDGIIDIQGVTVATVDDKLRLQDLQTWMDPLEIFRQIAPNGIVNKHPMNTKVNLEAALDVGPDVDGKAIAQQHDGVTASEHKHDLAPESVIPKHVSESTGKPADAFVPHQGTHTQQTSPSAQADVGPTAASSVPPEQDGAPGETAAIPGAQAIVNAGATQGSNAPISTPPSNYHEASANRTEGQLLSSELRHDNPIENPSERRQDGVVSPSIYTSAVTGNEEPVKPATTTATASTTTNHESTTTDHESTTRDAIDEHLERAAETVHPHPKDAEQSVGPAAGEAVAAAADSEETRVTHEEMSRMSPSECPFLMNRE